MLNSKPGFYRFYVTLSRLFTITLFLIVLFNTEIKAQSEPDYDEVSIYLNVLRIGNSEMTVAIRNQKAYLPVSDIFDFLKIENTTSGSRDAISGFFINQTATYLIDKTNNLIRYKDKTYNLKPGDIIKTPSNLYLASEYFGSVFALDCVFSFRNLSVTVNTELELPVLREMRLDQMRNNMSQLKGQAKVDTVIGRTYPLGHFGMVDWSVNSTQETNFGSDTRVNMALGGIVAGGETNVAVNYNTATPLLERDQYYMWRLANNDNPVLKQVVLGKIYGQSTASIYAPIVGAQITNTPTTYRRSFGTYTISNTTQPNWVVELYVNNVLINYVRADASGFYTFEVPLVYGNSQIKLRFYGPTGEERSSEQNISVPFNFLPKNEFEYTATAGIVEDGHGSRFSRLSANYGLNSMVTIGGGTEYLSSVTSGATMPFLNSSARILNSLLVSGEYTYGVRTKAIATYRFTSGLQLEYNDTWYKQGQTAINNTFLEERKAIISAPIRSSKFSVYTRLTLDQIILPVTRYTTAEWLISGAIGKLNATVNTYALFIDRNSPYFYSNFAISARVIDGFLFTQQAQFEYSTGRLVGYKEELEHRFLKKGYLDFSYENNISSNLRAFELGIRYDFSFAQTGATIRRSNYSTRFLQTANGSMIADAPTKYLGFNNHTSVGKGGITVVPFLDLNLNGRKDQGEPKVAGLKLRVDGGRIEQNVRDTTVRITDLEPYLSYTVEIDPLSFDNIAWRLRKHNFSVAVDPNKIKEIDVPITVSAEASGRVNLKTGNEQKGLGHIIINFYRNSVKKAYARTVTETDGYFTFLGLAPGDYTAKIDSEQLRKLNFVSNPTSLNFNIKKSTEGSIIDGLEFNLTDFSNTVENSSGIINDTTIISLKNTSGQSNQMALTDSIKRNEKDSTLTKKPVDQTAQNRLSDRAGKDSAAAVGIPENAILKDSLKQLNQNNIPAIGTTNEITATEPLKKAWKFGWVITAAGTKIYFPFEYDITVQVAHFKYRNAHKSVDYLRNIFKYDALMRPTTHHYYNVRITGINDVKSAKKTIQKIKQKGFPDAYQLARRRPPAHN